MEQRRAQAAVSAAGGLGSLGSSLLTTERVRADIARVRELTKNPFALNLTARPFSEEVFSLALEERPRVISFAIGSSRELVERAHAAGCLFMQSVGLVHDVPSAAEIVREMVAGAAEALRAAREGAPNGRLGRLEGAAE